MKKSEIKPGMVIVNEFNMIQIVMESPVNGEPCAVGYERYNSGFDNYPEDLDNQNEDMINIVCVGKFKKLVPLQILEKLLNTHHIDMFEDYIEILWKSKEDFYKDSEEKNTKREYLDALANLCKIFLQSCK